MEKQLEPEFEPENDKKEPKETRPSKSERTNGKLFSKYPSGDPIPDRVCALQSYLNRLSFWSHHASLAKDFPEVRTSLISACLTSIDSFIECLHSEDLNWSSLSETDLKSIHSLPYAKMLRCLRNADVHGNPIPICSAEEVNFRMGFKPGKSLRLTAGPGQAVNVSFRDYKPSLARSKNRSLDGKVEYSGAVIVTCQSGELFCLEPGTERHVHVMTAIRSFQDSAVKVLDAIVAAEVSLKKE